MGDPFGSVTYSSLKLGIERIGYRTESGTSRLTRCPFKIAVTKKFGTCTRQRRTEICEEDRGQNTENPICNIARALVRTVGGRERIPQH